MHEKELNSKLKKCHFMVRQGIVSGHEISRRGIEVDKSKIKVIAKLPTPKCIKNIQSFLGHARFYQRFIKNFSKIARPLINLLAKNVLILTTNVLNHGKSLSKNLSLHLSFLLQTGLNCLRSCAMPLTLPSALS